MIGFVAAAAGLTLAAVAVLLWPLLRPASSRRFGANEVNASVYADQLAEADAALAKGAMSAEEHRAIADAIRRRLLGDLEAATAPGAAVPAGTKWLAPSLGLVLPFAAAGLYFALGTPAALSPPAPMAAGRDAAHGLQGDQIAGRVERLALRLAANPEDVAGWVMLARSQTALGRFEDASRAYGEASRRAPRDANILADHADVLAMARGRRFDGEPDRLVAAALEANPNHVKALALAGSSAFNRGDYAAAADFWSRILTLAPEGSPIARSVEASLAEARARAAKGRGVALPVR